MLVYNLDFPVVGYLAEQYRVNANLLLQPVVKTRVKTRHHQQLYRLTETLHNNVHNAGI